MKNIFTSIAALAIATTAFAQGELLPAGGTYYPTDAMNQGCITAQFDDAVELPSASITVDGVAHEATVEAIGFSGTTYRVNVADVMNGQAANTAFTLSIGDLSANYVWQPVFPLSSVNPEAGTVLTSKDVNVVFNFSPAVEYTGVRITSGAVTTTLPGGSGSAVSVAVKEAYWGVPVGGINTITVALTGVTADGVSISNASGSEGTILAVYTIEDATQQDIYLGVTPTADEATYQEVYEGYWYTTFMFSDEVTLPMDEETVCATVVFYDADGEVLDSVDLNSLDVYGDWNYRSGYYGVDVAVPAVTEDAEEYYYAVVSLCNITYNDAPLANMPSVRYMATLPNNVMFKSRSNESAGISLNVANSETEYVNVYSITGALVKQNMSIKDIHTLDKGVYVANGKKYIVR